MVTFNRLSFFCARLWMPLEAATRALSLFPNLGSCNPTLIAAKKVVRFIVKKNWGQTTDFPRGKSDGHDGGREVIPSPP